MHRSATWSVLIFATVTRASPPQILPFGRSRGLFLLFDELYVLLDDVLGDQLVLHNHIRARIGDFGGIECGKELPESYVGDGAGGTMHRQAQAIP